MPFLDPTVDRTNDGKRLAGQMRRVLLGQKNLEPVAELKVRSPRLAAEKPEQPAVIIAADKKSDGRRGKGGRGGPPPPPTLTAEAPAPKDTVEILRGDRFEQRNFNRGDKR